MATVTHRVVAVAGWDNRQPIESDVATQIILAVSKGIYDAVAVTVTTLVQATMTAPTAGTSQIIIEMTTPDTALDSDIITFVSNAILALDLPTAPTITVISAVVF